MSDEITTVLELTEAEREALGALLMWRRRLEAQGEEFKPGVPNKKLSGASQWPGFESLEAKVEAAA